jgi:AcrR family transcriptional regulator
MPYPLQITREGVVQAAADLIAQHGVDALSLSAVAGVLGVKAPSLYRHFDAKTALVRAVNQHTVERLTAHLLAAVQPAAGTGERVRQMCRAYRRFALDHPRLYAAAYLHTHPEWAVGGEVAERLGSAMQAALGAVDLSMLRGAWALVHGFAALELGGLFEREGGAGVEPAFEAALSALVGGYGL